MCLFSAPTNEAFAKLPAETLESLLLPENKDMLVNILQYHVVSANAHSSSLESGDVPTLNGDSVTIDVSEDGVKVNDAMVVKADVIASNGIIHAIDTVLMPPDDSPADEDDTVEVTPESEATGSPGPVSVPVPAPVLTTTPTLSITEAAETAGETSASPVLVPTAMPSSKVTESEGSGAFTYGISMSAVVIIFSAMAIFM